MPLSVPEPLGTLPTGTVATTVLPVGSAPINPDPGDFFSQIDRAVRANSALGASNKDLIEGIQAQINAINLRLDALENRQVSETGVALEVFPPETGVTAGRVHAGFLPVDLRFFAMHLSVVTKSGLAAPSDNLVAQVYVNGDAALNSAATFNESFAAGQAEIVSTLYNQIRLQGAKVEVEFTTTPGTVYADQALGFQLSISGAVAHP